eukprot:CAMPEP_0197877918 /NCGR_PEP_ID=MMETSP1439-20131203/6460_1 /TAXON_ID=66791 /ORGANISM="Gonyaulax spinifera, Strain CCMP409" /LENGTH=861 /DNA_ID=CAMNT_0043497297 /DNA_START=57 /DNA_END=2639 /DNA_ORIENTATION=+
MAPKKRTTTTAPEPAAKKAKAEESKAKAAKKDEPKKEEPKKEEPKKEEPKKEEPKEAKDVEMTAAEDKTEKEKDAPKDSRQTIKDAVIFDTAETTLNVVPTTGGKVLMTLSDGGMQFLIAGARANVGLKAGRHLFEFKVVEALTHVEGGTYGRARVPLPRQLVRIGLSPAGSPLILDGEEGACFDSEGFYLADGKRNSVSARFGRDQVIGLLVNLDPKSPNANTMSLFRNGERITQPQPIPEKLQGKPLFPHVSFRNVSLQVHFGPRSLTTMPFTCNMLGAAATADSKVNKPTLPKDGKYDVIMPVAFPDEGTFEWLDEFLKTNPQYVELSDRKIQEWATQSGIWKPRNQGWRNSNDKPEFNYGINFVDDFSIHRLINSIASVVPRHFVVMEVKQNLVAADRANILKRFSLPHFKKIAHVVMGEPKPEWKDKVQKSLLEDKQQKAEREWKAKQLEKERKKAVAERQKQLMEEKLKREAEAKKKIAEAKKAAEKEGEGKKEGEEEKKEGEEKKEDKKKDDEKEDDEKKEDEKKEEKAEDAKAEEAKPEDDVPEECPTVELTEEEKKLNFKPAASNDLTPQVINTSFAQFSIPEDSEGFDVIRYEWQNAEGSKAYLKKWVLQRKVTSRVDDLLPGKWFEEQSSEFQKSIKEWQEKQKTFNDAKAKEDAKKGKKEGAEDDDEEDKKMGVDIFSVEDICDVGSGEPLFSGFEFEDWAMLTLRWELFTLQAAFAKDVNDPDRKGIHETHLPFYYSRYYKKQLNSKAYGKDSLESLCDLVKDAVMIDSSERLLASQLKEEQESHAHLLKLQEQCRRRRQQRIDAGDETARLDFSVLVQQQQRGPAAVGAVAAAGAEGAVAAAAATAA